MQFKKWIVPTAVALFVGLYTTFVAQSFWNWFAVPAFHASTVSFWGMYGIVALFNLLIATDLQTTASDQMWRAAFTMIEACIPPDRIEAVNEAIEAQTDLAWIKLGSAIFGKFAENTLSLVVGWFVHTALL